MPNVDPMAEALASLGRPIRPTRRASLAFAPAVESSAAPIESETSQPFRTKKGALKFQPNSDWSLSRLGEVESLYKQRQGTSLPIKVRGQGAIHNKWGLGHDDSADIGLNPSSVAGQALLSQLQEQKVPFLAFDQAIPGVSTGPHIHIGRPSKRRSQSPQFAAQQPSALSSDPMAEALQSLAPGANRAGRPKSYDASPSSTEPYIRPTFDPSKITAGAGAVVPDTDFSSVPGSVLKRKPSLPVNPSKIAIRPKPFMFDGASDAEIRASIQREVADEVARSTPQGRAPRIVGPELDAEVESRFQRFKQGRARDAEYARLGPSISARKPGTIERGRSAVAPYTPGLSSIDTPMGIKTDPVRGVIRGLTLGALGDQRQITPEEQLVNPEAEMDRSVAEFGGETAAGLVPFVAASKALSAIPALGRATRASQAGRIGTTFGSIEAAREGINAIKTGEPIQLREIAVSTAIGAAMGAIPGLNPTLKRRLVAAITPQVAADVARGRSLEEVAQAAITNVLFEAGAGRKLGLSAKRIGELRAEIEARQTVPVETQERIRRGENYPSIIRPTAQPSSDAPETSQRYYHRDWGEVIKAGDQVGARPGRTKVYEADNPDQFHYPRTADLSGHGNQRMVPVRAQAEPQPSEPQSVDPMADALTSLGAKIYRSQEPDAGPAQFRGLDEGALYDLAAEPQIPKGTSRNKRQQLADEQAAARAELQRRRTETPIEIIPPETGLRADTGDVPSFRDYVENRPRGGTRFETLEAGSTDFNRLADEYTARYGTRSRATQPAGAQERATQPPSPENAPVAPSLSSVGAVEKPRELDWLDVSPAERTRIRQELEAELGPPTRTAEDVDQLRDAFEKYDNTGEIPTVGDLVDTVEGIAGRSEEPWAQPLLNRIREYRDAQKESREQWGERMDVSGEVSEKIIEDVQQIIGNRTAPPQLERVAAGTVDVSPIQRATTLKELDAVGGKMFAEAQTNADLALIQKTMQERGRELEKSSTPLREAEQPSERKLLLAPEEAHQKTRTQLAGDDPLNPKAQPLVTALNDAGIPTVQSGDLYGKNLVYVDLPGGRYTEGKLTRGVDTYERALRNARLPAGWKVVRADTPASTAFETGKPEKPYTGPRATAVRLIRKGGAATPAEAQELAEAVRTALARPVKAPAAAGQEIEIAPLKTPGQKLRVASQDAEVIDAQRLDGVDYELYKAGDKGITRVYDADSGQVVGIVRHPDFASAAKAHSEALEANGGNVDAWRDNAPANAVKSVPKKVKAAREELPPVRTLSVGRESKAITERGSEVDTRYAIVGLEDLITSHDSALNPNPKFPQELQPRERDRAASADQISRIASRLRPDFLGESPKASEGAPIVGHDGIVESGNGRVLAIRQAYESKNPGSRAYKQFLSDNAERFGLDPKAITDKSNPVLVRIRTSEVDRPQFVKEANEQSIASMSPVEQARSDAKMLKGALLDLFHPSESGDINTAANMNFVRAFMKDVVGPNEIGRYTTASGQLSREGVARIRNGIFARAYGDSPEGLIALEKLAESPDNNVRNITTAMLRNAPGFASFKEGIDQGTRYPLDLAPDISAAMSKMSSLRENGMPIPDYLRQGALYGEDLTPIQKRLLQVFDENKRGANTIDSILKNYLRGADAAGSPDQAGLFGTETPSKADFIEAAILEAINAHKDVSPGLFTPSNQGLQSKPAPGGNNPAANPPETLRVSDRSGAITGEDTTNLAGKTETKGRALGRFDSAIDRLKAHEEQARQRLAERGTEFQKLTDQKGSELGATSIPQDIYDYVVIGASKLAQRSLNAAQFVDEMVREFGESIRKHARAIFKHSQRMVTDTQKEIRNERLSTEIAERLFTDNVPKEQQREALRIAARFRTSTDTQGKFISGFKSRVGEMAKSYGAAGGELTNRLHLGDIARGHEMEAGNQYLSKIQDVYSKTKNDFERIRISEAVIRALENRAEADRYLDTPEKQAVYKDTKEMLDMFRGKLTALGYETREDYFTHIRDVDILDQIISDAKDPKDVNLNDLVAAKSRFLQTRVDAKMEIKKDLPRVLFAYLKSVTKEIAYNDAVEYYYDSFPTDIPISLRKNSMDRAIKLMQNSLKPEQGRGGFYRTVGRLRSEQYRNFLAYNLKASAQNFTQVDFAKMRWTPEARSLVGKMWRNRKALTGPLADAIDLASTKQTPLMRFLEQFKGDEPSGTSGRFSEAFNKYDPFQRSEGRNWAMSELGSIINSVVKRPGYKELKAKMGAEGAINELLKKQDVFDAAVREAATTAAETQVGANPAMRGEFFDAPLHRIIGMFTAFKSRQMQILSEALRSHEGINGARAQTILRRGLSGDAQPVEVLREIEAQRTAMETMVKRARKFREDLGIPLRSLETMVQHLKAQEGELNSIIKRIEPLSGGRARSGVLVGRYFAKVAAISVFFNLFWDSVYSGIAGPEKDEDAEERVSTALHRAFWDVLPSPFYGANPSKFLVSPVAPNFERSAPFGHITKRGVARDVASYGSSVIPFAGVIDRATNRRLSGAVADLVAPKKEKEKKIVF